MRRIAFLALLIISFSSSGILAQPWTIQGKALQVNSSFFAFQSTHRFDSDSDKLAFSNDGRARLYGASFNITYGITDRLNATALVPVISYDFSDNLNTVSGSGLGDIRLSVKYKLIDRKIAASLESAVKFPSPNYSGSHTDVRIGEGQYDFELKTSVGFHPLGQKSFSSLDTGYRFRRKNEDSFSKPGNEFIFRFDNGYLLRNNLMLGIGAEGFAGGRIEQFGLKFANTERELFSLTAHLTRGLTPNTGISLYLNKPVLGKNYNAGSFLGVGLFFFRGNYRSMFRQFNLPAVSCQTICQI